MLEKDGFENWLRDNGVGEKSIVCYIGDVRGLLNWMREREEEVTWLSREMLLQYLEHNCMSDSTRNRKLVSFKKLTQYLLESGQIRSNPFEKAPKELCQRSVVNKEI